VGLAGDGVTAFGRIRKSEGDANALRSSAVSELVLAAKPIAASDSAAAAVGEKQEPDHRGPARLSMSMATLEGWIN
jgi:hypothetical protein